MKTPDLPPAPPCVSRAGFADMLDVSVRTVDRMIAAKEIPVHRVRGKVVRILRSDAERYLNGEKLKPEMVKSEIPTGCPGPEMESGKLKTPSQSFLTSAATRLTRTAQRNRPYQTQG